MSLSVCCLAGASGARVRALIEPLRQVADEVVIAADARVGSDDLRQYAIVADKLLRIEVVHSERHFAWLHAQCSGDWIFRIDADEFAAPSLVAAIPALVRSRDVRQYWIPRLWLYPDAAHWLDEPPWWPDYQLRLYRNDCFLRFAGVQHSTAVSQPPNVYLETPLVHLDLLVNNIEARERKARAYDELRPNLEAPGGGPMNQRFYLPERASNVRLHESDETNLREATRILGAQPLPSALDDPLPEVTPLRDSDKWLEGRPFDARVHRAVIEPTERVFTMYSDEQRVLHFRVTNIGDEAWPWHNPEIYEGRQVRLGYHWFNMDGSIDDYDGLRTWLPCRLVPGQSTVVPLMVKAPSDRGTYILEVDLVHERWFECGVRVEVMVDRGQE